jgi:hypothetical protein
VKKEIKPPHCGEAKRVPSSPGGVAQSTLHSPKEQKTRVRIPPGYKVLWDAIAMLLSTIDSICIVCVLKREIKALAKKEIHQIDPRAPSLFCMAAEISSE